MNRVTNPAADTGTIRVADLNEIRRLAAGGKFWEVLEERLQLTPAVALARLGATLGIEVLDMEALYDIVPDFDRLPYHEAVRRKCLVAHGTTEAPLCVLTDPFDLAQQSWLETRLGCAPQWRLAHPTELVAFFAVHEEKLRAMDGVLGAMTEAFEAEHVDCPRIEPYFVTCWNRWCGELPVGDALLAVAEPQGPAVVASFRGGAWNSVRTTGGEYEAASLRRLLDREALLQGFESKPGSWLHCPGLVSDCDELADTSICVLAPRKSNASMAMTMAFVGVGK